MVGVPGKYKGCETCRTRRVKCDNQRPKCRKCIDTGRECAGFKREMVFITATVDDGGRCSSHPPRKVMSSRSANSGPSAARKPQFQPLAALGHAWNDTMVMDNRGTTTSLQVVVHHAALDRVLDQDPGDGGGIKLWLPAYETPGLHVNATDKELSVKARCLVDSSPPGDASTPENNTILLIFEHDSSLLADYTTPPWKLEPTQLSNVNRLGSQSFRNFPDHHYFVRVYRHTAIMLALFHRQPTFLASEEWRTVPWEVYPKSPFDHLLDILVLIPALLRRADRITPTPATLARRLQAQDLLANCLAVESQLDGWHTRFASQVTPTSNRSPWAREPISPSLLLKAPQVPFSDRIVFKDGPTAVALLVYWTALLHFHTTIGRVHEAVCAPVLDSYPNLYPDLPPNLQIDPGRYRQCREYAMQICMGLEFALEAGVQLDALVAPLEAASAVYANINNMSSDGELEVDWCEGFRAHLVERGRVVAAECMNKSWVEITRF